MVADGGTAMGDGMARGLQPRRRRCPTEDGKGTRKLPAIIVLLSDGKNTLGVNDPLDIAAAAKPAHIPIYTIALGTEGGEVIQQDPFGFAQRIPVPPDKETLREIARSPAGASSRPSAPKDAEQIYSRIGTRLTSKPEQREVTAAFAGGGFVLLLAGGALSLVWFGRAAVALDAGALISVRHDRVVATPAARRLASRDRGRSGGGRAAIAHERERRRYELRVGVSRGAVPIAGWRPRRRLHDRDRASAAAWSTARCARPTLAGDGRWPDRARRRDVAFFADRASPRAPRRRRARGHDPRLLAPALADGRLRGSADGGELRRHSASYAEVACGAASHEAH